MEDRHFRPEPANAKEIWAIPPGQHVRFSLRYLNLTVCLTFLVTLVATLSRSTPQSVLESVNSSMISIGRPSSEFVTMFCAVLNHRSNRLLYSSAGHNPPVLLHDGTTMELELGGSPLALSEDITLLILRRTR